VALKDEHVEPSRKKLFEGSITINDADNGACLPRWAGKGLAGLPNAARHVDIHTEVYRPGAAVSERLLPRYPVAFTHPSAERTA
jgi:hypothetical protein